MLRHIYNISNFTLDFDNFTLKIPREASLSGGYGVDGGLFVFTMCCVALLMVLTTIANAVMICVVTRTPNVRTATNLLCTNLAIADIGIGITALPAWIFTLQLPPDVLDTTFLDQFCQAVSYFTVTLLIVATATIAIISLDRYFSVCHPFIYPTEVTAPRVQVAVVSTWLYGACIASGPIFGWGQYRYRPRDVQMCHPQWKSSTSFALFVLIWGIFVPFSLMVFSYFRITQEARKQMKLIDGIQFKFNGPQEAQRELKGEAISDNANEIKSLGVLEKLLKSMARENTGKNSCSLEHQKFKALKTGLIVIGVFALCFVPYILLSTYIVWSKKRPIPYGLDFVTTYTMFASCAINPFITIGLTRDFRCAARILFAQCLDFICQSEPMDGAYSRRSSFQTESVMEMVRISSRRSSFCDIQKTRSVDRNCHALSSANHVTTGAVSLEITTECKLLSQGHEQQKYGALSIPELSSSSSYSSSSSVVCSSRKKSYDGFTNNFSTTTFVSQFGSTLKPPDSHGLRGHTRHANVPSQSCANTNEIGPRNDMVGNPACHYSNQ